MVKPKLLANLSGSVMSLLSNTLGTLSGAELSSYVANPSNFTMIAALLATCGAQTLFQRWSSKKDSAADRAEIEALLAKFQRIGTRNDLVMRDEIIAEVRAAAGGIDADRFGEAIELLTTLNEQAEASDEVLERIEQIVNRVTQTLGDFDPDLLEAISDQVGHIDETVVANNALLRQILALHNTAAAPSETPVRMTTVTRPKANFTGRESLRAELGDALARGSVALFNTVGLGGVGKTELARRLAYDVRDRFAGGIVEVDFFGKSTNAARLSGQTALVALLRELGHLDQLPDDPQQLKALYYQALADRPTLIVCDDVGDASQLDLISPPPDGSVLLITSRVRLDLADCDQRDVERFAREESVAYLQLALTAFDYDDAALDSLADACSDLPKALEVAASIIRVDGIPVEDVVMDLNDAADAVRSGATPEDAVYAEVKAVVGQSLKRLGNARATWRKVGIFPADFDADAAATVLGVDDARAARKALAPVRRRSLLEWDAAADRYRMHDLVRDLSAGELANKPDEVAAAEEAFLTEYTNRLHRANTLYDQHGEATFEGLSLYDADSANVDTVYDRLRVRDNEEQSKDSGRRLVDFVSGGPSVLANRHLPADYARWLEAVLAVAERLAAKTKRRKRLATSASSTRIKAGSTKPKICTNSPSKSTNGWDDQKALPFSHSTLPLSVSIKAGRVKRVSSFTRLSRSSSA